MSVTILYKERPPYSSAATAEGGDLWVPADELPAAAGWALRPEGACRGDTCVPIPRGREAEFLRERPARFNLAALARLCAEPVVHDDARGVWSFANAATRLDDMESLRAADFTLPDLEGRPHALAEYRGKKVFLVFWASW